MAYTKLMIQNNGGSIIIYKASVAKNSNIKYLHTVFVFGLFCFLVFLIAFSFIPISEIVPNLNFLKTTT